MTVKLVDCIFQLHEIYLQPAFLQSALKIENSQFKLNFFEHLIKTRLYFECSGHDFFNFYCILFFCCQDKGYTCAIVLPVEMRGQLEGVVLPSALCPGVKLRSTDLAQAPSPLSYLAVLIICLVFLVGLTNHYSCSLYTQICFYINQSYLLSY